MKTFKKYRPAFFLISFCFFLILTSCRKDIALPDNNVKKLFGTWRLAYSSGGYSGQTYYTSYPEDIEFREDGIYKKYFKGVLSEKSSFSLSEGHSIYQTGNAYLITYYNSTLRDNSVYPLIQSFWFSTPDSLFLNDEAEDGWQNIYIKL